MYFLPILESLLFLGDLLDDLEEVGVMKEKKAQGEKDKKRLEEDNSPKPRARAMEDIEDVVKNGSPTEEDDSANQGDPTEKTNNLLNNPRNGEEAEKVEVVFLETKSCDHQCVTDKERHDNFETEVENKDNEE